MFLVAIRPVLLRLCSLAWCIMLTTQFKKYVPLICCGVMLVCFLLKSDLPYIDNKHFFQHFQPFKISPTNVSVDDLTITIKTTQDNFKDRIPLLWKTWVNKVINQTYVVTDDSIEDVAKELPEGHVITTDCEKGRGKWLCCKAGEEFAIYANQGKRKWWCHFDDDVYVNMNSLLNFLSQFDPDEEYIYAGQVTRKFEISRPYGDTRVAFRHITGATYCMSRALNQLIEPWVNGMEKMMKTCKWARSPDDVALGFLINGVLNITVTHSDLFHSHIGQLRRSLRKSDLLRQITLSYKSSNIVVFNDQKPTFNETEDPTRLLSIHCMLYPDDDICEGGILRPNLKD